ncbi:MAG TPA: hypothetical protein P5518_01615 [Candidatus Cloacimonas sp.]|nr:hypothetical protein [Candidatus Cloacimonas sp.]MDD2249910.1 hypothetical protein [Candidatus Cloacimonadota bacterium]MCK9157911.1 hypothetical protein [Candidatus Cloacimonas sp.]MCK9164658.1 hypothetical protein [Candidatus Cloacimonas sp.]MDD3733702.1 hypothetical protein [Candidatus Cloacimonadota bacterium]
MDVLKYKFWLIVLIVLSASIPLLALPKIVYPVSSLILPGSGELLLGHNTRGATLLGADLVNLYAFYATDKEIDLQKENYMKFAELYAGVPYGMPKQHYQAVQNYPSSSYYNNIQDMMARNYYLIYNYDPQSYTDYIAANTYQGDEEWNWQSEDKWNQYKAIRKRHQKAKMNNQLCLGLLLLNRCLSVIDSSILSKKEMGNVYLSPLSNEGAMLHYQIDF